MQEEPEIREIPGWVGWIVLLAVIIGVILLPVWYIASWDSIGSRIRA